VKRFCNFVGASIALVTACLNVSAANELDTRASFPSKPIRIIVGFAPGGPTDRMAREIAPKLQEAFGQTVTVENRPGADSRIAFDLVARAEPDGHTLLVSGMQAATHMAVYKTRTFDTLRDFEPVTQLSTATTILAVSAASKVKSVDDLLKLAKHRSEPLSYASSGVASSPHLAGAMFAAASGAEFIHIPYSGAAPAQNALVGGQIDFAFVSPMSSAALLRDGKLRALAATSNKRLSEFPDVPTLMEVGLRGFEVSGWQGLLAPAKTPQATIEKIQREIARILDTPESRARLHTIGAEVVVSTPTAFRQYIRNEIERWTIVARRAQIEID
jgi:tripartite-type tricarboxylate transporter receptor subunit TctC